MAQGMSSSGGVTATSLVARNQDELLTTVVDGELIALGLSQGACYGFNAVATRIWDLLETPLTVDEVVGQLTQEYDIEAGECRRQVLEFVGHLQSEGLVSVSAR